MNIKDTHNFIKYHSMIDKHRMHLGKKMTHVICKKLQRRIKFNEFCHSEILGAGLIT